MLRNTAKSCQVSSGTFKQSEHSEGSTEWEHIKTIGVGLNSCFGFWEYDQPKIDWGKHYDPTFETNQQRSCLNVERDWTEAYICALADWTRSTPLPLCRCWSAWVEGGLSASEKRLSRSSHSLGWSRTAWQPWWEVLCNMFHRVNKSRKFPKTFIADSPFPLGSWFNRLKWSGHKCLVLGFPRVPEFDKLLSHISEFENV